MQALLPEGKPVYLRDRGIGTLPLHTLNTALEPLGYVIHPAKVRDAKRFVACTNKQGRVEQYGLFELRQVHQEPPGRAIGKRSKGKIAPRPAIVAQRGNETGGCDESLSTWEELVRRLSVSE